MADIPRICRHATGQAFTKLNGRNVYLGRWGTPEAQAKYDEVIAAWIANGRSWPIYVASELTVSAAGTKFTDWAKRTYRKAGRVTSTGKSIACVCNLLKLAGFGNMPLARFNLQRLKDFQEYLIIDKARRWSRKTINAYVEVAKGLVRWAVGDGLLGDPEQFSSMIQSLDLLKPLREGAIDEGGNEIAREGRGVKSVPTKALEATLNCCSPVVADMIRVQLLTGMRPTEIVRIRPADLKLSNVKDVWVYTVPVAGNKTHHKKIERLVAVGPKAAEILARWTPADPHDYYFRPIEARKYWDAKRSELRTSERWASHSTEARRKARRRGVLSLSPHYSPDTYRQAVQHAAARAKVTLWAPNQLRHSAADNFTTNASIFAAQQVLGHTSVSTTKIYVSVANKRALKVAKKLG